ncbi:MAG: ParA family protein [Ruminococcaceae bacterium]|nr:ParA family protein [Oscillospiraceae bacterium]
MKEYIILIGNYGSGKTELALNFALRAADAGKKTEVIDLDLVNTYFRLTDRGNLVKSKEIRLVSPNFAGMNVEALSVPAEVASAFAGDWDTVIFDVGGDPTGAAALGRYFEDFAELPPGSLTVLNVINTKRPMAGTSERIIELMRDMERYSRQTVSGFVNNTNLAKLTGPGDLAEGYEIIKQASIETGIPVLYTTGKKEFLDAFLAEGHDPKYIGTPMAIDTFMHRDWDSFTRFGL